MPKTFQYSSDIFTLVRMSELSKQHFDYHPIWSEHYDYEEFDEIISWGIDPIWLEAELKRVHTGNDHCAYPILRPYPLPERMRLYIKARITTFDGQSLEGYVMNEDARLLSIFANGDKFVFDRNELLDDLNSKELERLGSTLARSTDGIFPARYETDFLDSKDNLIASLFSI